MDIPVESWLLEHSVLDDHASKLTLGCPHIESFNSVRAVDWATTDHMESGINLTASDLQLSIEATFANAAIGTSLGTWLICQRELLISEQGCDLQSKF